jgi:hypothetical protein
MENQDGVAVGAAMNLHMLYDFQGQAVKAAVGAGASIDPPYRGKSMMILAKTLKEHGGDITMVGSANAAVAKVNSVLAKRIPSPASNVPLLWPLNYQKFALSALKKKNVGAADFLSWPAGLAMRAADLVRRRPASKPANLRIDVSADFDDEFDALWHRIRSA